MTSYFDTATSAVTDLASFVKAGESDDLYVKRVQHIEAPVIQIALANTCDAQFPDDLRRKVCRVIAKNDYTFDPHEGRAGRTMLIGTRHSDLIADLHSVFHDLARRRAPLRGTTWSDSPTQNLLTIASDPAATDVEKQRLTRPSSVEVIRALAMSIPIALAHAHRPPSDTDVRCALDAAAGILRELEVRTYRKTPAGEPCDVCGKVYCDHVWAPR